MKASKKTQKVLVWYDRLLLFGIEWGIPAALVIFFIFIILSLCSIVTNPRGLVQCFSDSLGFFPRAVTWFAEEVKDEIRIQTGWTTTTTSTRNAVEIEDVLDMMQEVDGTHARRPLQPRTDAATKKLLKMVLRMQREQARNPPAVPQSNNCPWWLPWLITTATIGYFTLPRNWLGG